MTPERWQQVGRLFQETAALAADERASFLSKACGDDAALRREVESLLGLEERAGEFLVEGAMADAAKAVAEEEPPSLAGKRLGHYDVLALVGVGGMGEVYRARDSVLKREVAVKVLPASLSANPERLRRFKREARAASALNHPNIVTIHEISEAENCHFIVSELVEGETLRKRLAGGRIMFGEALDVAIQVASALDAAHRAGVVHRDIKPENVMIRTDGLVKVLDFGLAKLTEGPVHTIHSDAMSPPPTQTRPGMIVGTVHYMSPEQARGQEVDERSDLFSLGVMLYEMLAGRRPFEGPTPSDVVAAILTTEPEPLAGDLPEGPKQLQWIVSKALRKEREERYQTAREFLADLKRLKGELEIPDKVESKPASGAGIFNKVKRHRLSLGLILAALIIAAGVALAVILIPRSRPTDAPPARGLTRLTFDPGLQSEPTWSPDGRLIAYSSDKSGNFDIWVKPVAGGDAVQITRSPAHDWQPDWSPDGSQIVFRSEREGGGLFVVPALGGHERRIASFGYRPRWSPDGTKILFSNSMQAVNNATKVYVVSLDGNAPREVQAEFIADFVFLGSVTWHPDGQRISLFGERRIQEFGFWTLPLAGGTPVKSEFDVEVKRLLFPERPSSTDGPLNIRWAPSGRAIYFESIWQGVRNLWKVTVDPQTLQWVAGPERLTTGSNDTDIALSPDGKRIAFTERTESTRAWSLPFDARTGKLKGEGQSVTSIGMIPAGLNLSRDGKKLLYVALRPGTQKAELWEKSLEDNRETLLMVADFIGDPCRSRDGTRIAYEGFRPANPISDGRSIFVLPSGGGDEQVIASGAYDLIWDWSADGQWILVTTDRQTPMRWEQICLYPLSAAPHAETQMRVVTFRSGYSLFQERFSPDDRWICFEAFMIGNESIIYVVPSSGGEWIRITEDKVWSDKPHWSPDGKTIYFLSNRVIGFYNVWGIRFDPGQGKPAGEPFRVTSFDSPGKMVWTDLGNMEITLSADRLVLPITEVTGSIWVLDNVDR